MEYADVIHSNDRRMASDPPGVAGAGRSGSVAQNLRLRQLSTGTVRHVMHDGGSTVVAGDVPELFLRLAGRGHLAWEGASGKDRSGACILMPPGAQLEIKGKLRALRVTLPNLMVTSPIGPLNDVLVSVLCPRAWNSSDLVAEASFNLMQLLIEEELAKRVSGRR